MEVKKIIKWRNVWMGIAMLWMVWYHSGLMVDNQVVMLVKGWGYGGVDIFLFASGLGCYYSLDKNSDFVEFIKRRIQRIIPTYWLFLVFWIAFRYMTVGFSKAAVIGNFLCVQTFTGLGNDFNWYISAMWLLYFLAPFFYTKVKKYSAIKDGIGMIVILLLITIPFWNSATYVIMVTRIPIFFLGMILGKMAKADAFLSKPYIFILIGLACVGVGALYYFGLTVPQIMWSHGLYWYPFILIVPGFCVLISCVMEKITEVTPGKWVDKVLSLIGKYSFEVYLMHAFIYEVYRTLFGPLDIKYSTNLYWGLVVIMVVPGCMLFVGLNKGITRLREMILKSD